MNILHNQAPSPRIHYIFQHHSCWKWNYVLYSITQNFSDDYYYFGGLLNSHTLFFSSHCDIFQSKRWHNKITCSSDNTRYSNRSQNISENGNFFVSQLNSPQDRVLLELWQLTRVFRNPVHSLFCSLKAPPAFVHDPLLFLVSGIAITTAGKTTQISPGCVFNPTVYC